MKQETAPQSPTSDRSETPQARTESIPSPSTPPPSSTDATGKREAPGSSDSKSPATPSKKQITVYPPIDDPTEAIRTYDFDKDEFTLRHYMETKGPLKPSEYLRTRYAIALPGFADKTGNTQVVFTGILAKHDLNLPPLGKSKWSEKRSLTINYPTTDLYDELAGSAIRQLDMKLQNLSFLGTPT
jgi:hypothetical protein